jgi:hypothetical protein
MKGWANPHKIEKGQMRQLVSWRSDLKLFCVVSMFLFTVGLTSAKSHYTDAYVLQYAKSLDVQKLDPSLSSQKLEDWLRHGPAHLDEVLWRVSRDCDLKEPAPGIAMGDSPLCVRFTFRRRRLSGWSLIRVGTRRIGITGPAHFEYFSIVTERRFPQSTTSLSELPQALRELSVDDK